MNEKKNNPYLDTANSSTPEQADTAAKETAGTAEALEPLDSADGISLPVKNKGFLRVLRIVLLAAVVLLAAAGIVHTIYYRSHWYGNTKINGIDVSGMTLAVAKDTLLAQYEAYSLTIYARNDGTLTIDGSEISYTLSIDEAYELLYTEQHKGLSLFPSSHNYTLTYDVSYDADALEALLTNCDFVSGSADYTVSAPVNAFVKYSKKQKQYIIVEEDNGNELIYSAFLDTVEEALQQAQTSLDLTADSADSVYTTPEITADDEALQTELSLCNNAALRYIIWNMGDGVKEKITPKEISRWIVYEDGAITYDYDAVEDWIETFCLKYKTVGTDRELTTHNGKTVTVSGGDYGWQLDYTKTLKQAKRALKAEIEDTVIQDYLDDPSAEHKKAITFKKKVAYLNTAYQKVTDASEVDWDSENYIEVSLKAQKVYVIRNGKVKFSCRCITGNSTKGRATPTGTYFIKEHKQDYTMVGEDYTTFVKYWVRITWTGVGFHPASWQPWSRWTKELYKTNGSHGCVNLEPDDAETIYNMSEYREAVFIY